MPLDRTTVYHMLSDGETDIETSVVFEYDGVDIMARRWEFPSPMYAHPTVVAFGYARNEYSLASDYEVGNAAVAMCIQETFWE